MAYIPDLAPCTYIPFSEDRPLIAIGWLERGQAYTCGEVRETFFKIVRLIKESLAAAICLGWLSFLRPMPVQWRKWKIVVPQL